MERRNNLIVVFYDPATRLVWGRGGKFVSLEEFAKYPPSEQREVIPQQAESVPNPKDIPPDPGPTVKCINGQEHLCFDHVCFQTGRTC